MDCFVNIITTTFVIYVLYISKIYVKRNLLYYPKSASDKKYLNFFKKIYSLTDNPENIINKYVISDGFKIDMLYIVNPDTNKTVIYFHGNSGNISTRFEIIKFIYNYASVIIFDYRTFGRSSNSYTSTCQTMENDCLAVWNYAIDELKINPNNITFMGESIGCYFALWITSYISLNYDEKYYPDALILNSPWYSLKEFVCKKTNFIYPFNKLITCFITDDEYSNAELIQLINHKTHVVIAHSPMDEIIPMSDALKLYEIISVSSKHPLCEFIEICGSHNNLILNDDYIQCLSKIFY